MNLSVLETIQAALIVIGLLVLTMGEFVSSEDGDKKREGINIAIRAGIAFVVVGMALML
jgi:hypothetical protein